MEKITAKQLVEDVAYEVGMSKVAVKGILEAAAARIVSYASDGTAVAYPGFGKFYPADRSGRVVKSSITGTEIIVPPRRVLLFKPSASKKIIG